MQICPYSKENKRGVEKMLDLQYNKCEVPSDKGDVCCGEKGYHTKEKKNKLL